MTDIDDRRSFLKGKKEGQISQNSEVFHKSPPDIFDNAECLDFELILPFLVEIGLLYLINISLALDFELSLHFLSKMLFFSSQTKTVEIDLQQEMQMRPHKSSQIRSLLILRCIQET